MKGALKTFAIGALLAGSAIAFADQAKPAAGPRPPPSNGGAATMVAPMPPKQPPAPMPDMKPPAEVAAAAKLMVGSYKCKGNDMNPDGSSHPSLATMKISTDLDGYYILVDLTEQKTKENPTPFKAHMFRTYDDSSKKWINTLIGSAPGGPITMTSTDTMGTGTVMWTGSMTMMGQSMTEHSHEEPDAKTNSVHIWGEFSLDGGKTFTKDYDITCKK